MTKRITKKLTYRKKNNFTVWQLSQKSISENNKQTSFLKRNFSCSYKEKVSGIHDGMKFLSEKK